MWSHTIPHQRAEDGSQILLNGLLRRSWSRQSLALRLLLLGWLALSLLLSMSLLAAPIPLRDASRYWSNIEIDYESLKPIRAALASETRKCEHESTVSKNASLGVTSKTE